MGFLGHHAMLARLFPLRATAFYVVTYLLAVSFPTDRGASGCPGDPDRHLWLTLHTAQAPRSIRVGVADLLSKLFGFPVDADGLIAETKAFVGAANIAAGSFQGFPVSTSGSRAAVSAQRREDPGHRPGREARSC